MGVMQHTASVRLRDDHVTVHDWSLRLRGFQTQPDVTQIRKGQVWRSGGQARTFVSVEAFPKKEVDPSSISSPVKVPMLPRTRKTKT